MRVRASPVAPSIYGGSKAVMHHHLKCELTSSLTAILTETRYATMIIAGSTPARRTTKPELKESLRSKGLDPDDFDILMVVAGFLWPLAVGMALAHGLFKND